MIDDIKGTRHKIDWKLDWKIVGPGSRDGRAAILCLRRKHHRCGRIASGAFPAASGEKRNQ